MYSIKLLPRAQKDLDRLEGAMFKLVVKAVRSLGAEPRPPGCKKLVAREGYRVRIRDHRILYRLDEKRKVVFIYRVRHRGQAYR